MGRGSVSAFLPIPLPLSLLYWVFPSQYLSLTEKAGRQTEGNERTEPQERAINHGADDRP